MKRKLILFAALFSAALCGLQAQYSNLAYSSQRMPQCNLANPAVYPARNGFYFTLPGVNLNLGSPLAYSDLIQTRNDTSYINLNSIVDTLANNGNILFNTNINLAGIGFKAGKLFLNANADMHIGFRLGLAPGLSQFLNQGIGEGASIDLLSDDLLDANMYMQLGIGAGYELFKGLTVGARLKILDGFFDISTTKAMLRLSTAEDCSALTADVNYQLVSGGVLAMDTAMLKGGVKALAKNVLSELAANGYLPSNYGYGLDLGARWEWRKLDLSASVQDLGASIRWEQNVRNITPGNPTNPDGSTSFTFEGMDLNGILDEGSGFNVKEIFSSLIDTLVTSVSPAFNEGEAYRTYLPTKLNLSAMYKITPWFRVGALYHGEFNNKSVKLFDEEAFHFKNYRGHTSVVAQASFFDWLEVIANVGVVNDGNKVSWFNPGIGFNLSLFKSIQVYGMMDYISNMYLVDAKTFNISVGANLMLGNKKFQFFTPKEKKDKKDKKTK